MPPHPDPTRGWRSWTSAQIIAEFISHNGDVALTLPAASRDRLLQCHDQLLKWRQPKLDGRQEPPPLDRTSVEARLTKMLEYEPIAIDAKRLAQLPSATEMMDRSVLLEERHRSGEPAKVVIPPGSGPEDRLLRALQGGWSQARQQLNHSNPTIEVQRIAAAVTHNVNAAASSPRDPRTRALLSQSARLMGQYVSSTATRTQSQERPAPSPGPAPSRSPSPPPPAQSH